MHYLGIDIAAETHVAAVVSEDGGVVLKPTPFTEDRDGYDLLLRRVEGAHRRPLPCCHHRPPS